LYQKSTKKVRCDL